MMLYLSVVITMATVVNGQFSPLWSMDIEKDHALLGHIIKTVSMFKPDCMAECRQTLTCFSINIYKDKKGGHMCDLLRSTKKQSPGSFTHKPGYDYAEAKESKYCPKENCVAPKEALPNMVYMFNSSHFQLISLKKTWEEARQYCQTLGADLASFSSELESRFVDEVLVLPSPRVFFGQNEAFLARLIMDGHDANIRLYGDAKYESTNNGVALYMNGTGDHATYPRFPFYNKSYTFCAWIKITSYKNHAIMSDNDDLLHKRSFTFKVISQDKQLKLQMNMFFPNGNKDELWRLTSNSAFLINQWMHVGFTFDINTHVGKIYFNAGLDKSGSASVSSKNMNNYATSSYQIGRLPFTNTERFEGWMKDLSMIDRVLDRCEMKALKSGGWKRAWIGFNDKTTEKVFQWSNGSPMIFKNSNPLNSQANDCAKMSSVMQLPEKWCMGDCQEKLPFICRK